MFLGATLLAGDVQLVLQVVCANSCLNFMNKQTWMNSSGFMPWPKQTVGYILIPGVGKLLLFFWIPPTLCR